MSWACGDRQVCQKKVWSQPSLEKMCWTFPAALNHLLNRQRAVIGADTGRSVLSGKFNSCQYTILVYLDLMDMPFLPSQLSVCLLPFLFVLPIGITVCCTLIVQSAGQIFAATTPVCRLGKWTAKFDFGAVHKNMCLNKCVCLKWVWICLFECASTQILKICHLNLDSELSV